MVKIYWNENIHWINFYGTLKNLKIYVFKGSYVNSITLKNHIFRPLSCIIFKINNLFNTETVTNFRPLKCDVTYKWPFFLTWGHIENTRIFYIFLKFKFKIILKNPPRGFEQHFFICLTLLKRTQFNPQIFQEILISFYLLKFFHLLENSLNIFTQNILTFSYRYRISYNPLFIFYLLQDII